MKIAVLTIVWVFFLNSGLLAQSFDVSGLQENYKGYIGDNVKASFNIKNTTNKTISLVLKRVSSQLGSTQKSFMSISGNNLDASIEDYVIKLEPGQLLSTVSINLEAGLVSGYSTARYVLFNKSNPADLYTLDLNFLTEERVEKSTIFNSASIVVYDVYPNPVVDHAVIQYQILRDRVNAKIIIHNILGNQLSQYELPAYETKLKMRAEDFNPGIYFYTLYIENEAVMTRKLIVKK